MQLPYIKEVQQLPVILIHDKNIFTVKKARPQELQVTNNNCN